MALCEGGTLADVRHKLRKDFWPTFSAELTVWPVIQVGSHSLTFLLIQVLTLQLYKHPAVPGRACIPAPSR